MMLTTAMLAMLTAQHPHPLPHHQHPHGALRWCGPSVERRPIGIPMLLRTTAGPKQSFARTSGRRMKLAFLTLKGPALWLAPSCEAGSCFVEKGSIYGAAILMPQLARSMDWHRLLTIEAFRSFILIGVSIFLQVSLLVMLARKETVYDTFAGQMFLCDLGAGCIQGDSSRCMGPSGTEITPPRLYSFDIWTTRIFVRESLKAIFPDKQDDIQDLIDPGEYGLESYWCRLLCCILFVMSMLKEATNIIGMGKVLYYPPTRADSWLGEGMGDSQADIVQADLDSGDVKTIPVSSDDPEDARANSRQSVLGDKKRSTRVLKSAEDLASAAVPPSGDVFEEDWLDSIDLKIAGMPLMWKVINAVCILLPKILVWKLTVQTGITFLMETASISDLVVNSIALTFILSIDEMICETLTSQSTLSMLSRCKDYPLFDIEAATMSDDELLTRYGGAKLEEGVRCRDLLAILFPTRLVCVIIITIYFVWSYYRIHCQQDGATFWPNPLRTPTTAAFSIFNALFPDLFPIHVVDEPSWEMPEK